MPRRVARTLRHVLSRCAGVDGPVPWVDAAVASRAVELGLASVTESAVRTGRARAALDPERADELRRAADREIALVLAAEDEARRAVALLAGASIPVLALKGLVANACLHRPRGWCRAPGDLDLLVPADAIEEATRIFLRADYEPHGALGAEFYAAHHHARPFVRRGRRAFPIELHRRVSGTTTGGIHVDHAGLWERSVPFVELGPGARRPDDVDHLLATILHVDRDDAYGGKVRQLFDLAVASPTLEARRDEMLERAGGWNARATVLRALALLDDFLFRAPHPDAPRGLAAHVWRATGIDLAVADGTNDALPVWYRQGVFRAVSHERGWREILARVFAPLRSRSAGRA